MIANHHYEQQFWIEIFENPNLHIQLIFIQSWKTQSNISGKERLSSRINCYWVSWAIFSRKIDHQIVESQINTIVILFFQFTELFSFNQKFYFKIIFSSAVRWIIHFILFTEINDPLTMRSIGKHLLSYEGHVIILIMHRLRMRREKHNVSLKHLVSCLSTLFAHNYA